MPTLCFRDAVKFETEIDPGWRGKVVCRVQVRPIPAKQTVVCLFPTACLRVRAFIPTQIPVFNDMTARPSPVRQFVVRVVWCPAVHPVLSPQRMEGGADVDIKRSWPTKRYDSWEGGWASTEGLTRNE